MPALPEQVNQAWEDRDGPAVFTTVGKDGQPNAVYVTCVSKFSNEIMLVANNYFSKTLENILAGCKGSLLFITKDGKSYQIKGSIAYHTDGPIFDNMKPWNPTRLPGHAVAAINVEEVYSGAKKLL